MHMGLYLTPRLKPSHLPHLLPPFAPLPSPGVGVSTMTGEVRRLMGLIMQIDQVGGLAGRLWAAVVAMCCECAHAVTSSFAALLQQPQPLLCVPSHAYIVRSTASARILYSPFAPCRLPLSSACVP